MKLLVTGGSGFIGTNFIKHWLKQYPEDLVVNVDAMTYAAVESNHCDTKKFIPAITFLRRLILVTTMA